MERRHVDWLLEFLLVLGFRDRPSTPIDWPGSEERGNAFLVVVKITCWGKEGLERVRCYGGKMEVRWRMGDGRSEKMNECRVIEWWKVNMNIRNKILAVEVVEEEMVSLMREWREGRWYDWSYGSVGSDENVCGGDFSGEDGGAKGYSRERERSEGESCGGDLARLTGITLMWRRVRCIDYLSHLPRSCGRISLSFCHLNY